MRAAGLLLSVLVAGGVACTNDAGGGDGSVPPPSVSAPPTHDVAGRIVQGEWTYELYGIKASFTWKPDGDPTLSVKNGSDRSVGAPDVYVVTRDQRHVDGKVANAAELDPSASGDYDVSFPPDLTPDDVGLVVLELGGVNWGALGPKLAGT